jgi:hypothetical protein
MLRTPTVVLVLVLAGLLLAACGGQVESSTDTASDDDAAFVENDPSSDGDEYADATDRAAMTPDALMQLDDTEWEFLDADQQAAVARAFMAKYRKAFPRVTGGALLHQVKFDVENEVFGGLGATLETTLKDSARGADAQAIFEAKSKYLPSKKAVGMRTTEAKRLMGPPDRDQDIQGVGQMWYYDLQDNMYQLTLSSGTITGVNKY